MSQQSSDYYKGVIAAACLLATWGMDDAPKHFARALLKQMVPSELLPVRIHDCDCQGCGWKGQAQEDVLPNQSIYCPNCRRAVWPDKYKFRKSQTGDKDWRS